MKLDFKKATGPYNPLSITITIETKEEEDNIYSYICAAPPPREKGMNDLFASIAYAIRNA